MTKHHCYWEDICMVLLLMVTAAFQIYLWSLGLSLLQQALSKSSLYIDLNTDSLQLVTNLKCIFYVAFNPFISFFKNARLSIRYPLWVCCVEHEAEAALQDIWWKSSQDAGVKSFVMNMYSFLVKRHEALHLEDTRCCDLLPFCSSPAALVCFFCVQFRGWS